MRPHNRRTSSRRAAAVAGGLLATVLALAACGDGDDSSEDVAEDAAETTAEGTADEAAPAEDAEGSGSAADSPEAAVEAFYEEDAAAALWALAEGEFETLTEIAERHFCSEYVAEFEALAEEMESVPGGRFGEPAEGMEEFTDITIEILEVTEDGDTATVEAELTHPDLFSDGMATEAKTIELRKEDQEWKLCSSFLLS